MPLRIACAEIDANSTHIFTFDQPDEGTITQRFVGLQKFTLSFGGPEHHVKRMSIGLVANHSGRDLQVTPVVRLSDASGNVVSNSTSKIGVVAMAWLGTNDDRLLLAGSLRSPSTVQLPVANPHVLQAGLAGFDMFYSDSDHYLQPTDRRLSGQGSGDHHIQTVECRIGCQGVEKSAIVTGQAEMHDTTGHYAIVESTGNLIAIGDPGFPAIIKPTCGIQATPESITFAGMALQSFQPVLSGFKARFDGGVKSISAKLDATALSANTVRVEGGVYVDGNRLSNDDSSVTGFVINY